MPIYECFDVTKRDIKSVIYRRAMHVSVTQCYVTVICRTIS